MSLPRSVLIVGANAAGVAALAGLRRNGFVGEITLIDADPEASCARPALSKEVLLSGVAYADIPLASPEVLKAGVTRIVAEAVSLNAEEMCVRLNTGAVVASEKIVLATGSTAVRPSLEGDASVETATLRSWDDAMRLKRLAGGARIVIMGGGVIGCEVAAALARNECTVTLLEAQPRLLARAFAGPVGAHARRALETVGVDVRLRASAQEIRQGAVLLAGGDAVAADLVLFGVGARPRTALAAGAGLDCDGAICVSARGETSSEGIYAAGDVALGPFGWKGAMERHESQTAAQEQGFACASAIMGKGDHTWMPYVWSDQGDSHYAQIGWRPAGAASLERETASGAPILFHCDNDELAGATLIGSGRDLGAVRRLIGAPLETLAGLTDPGISLRDLAKTARAARGKGVAHALA